MNDATEEARTLRRIRVLNLVFERLWLSEPCQHDQSYTVFVSKQKDGQWRLSLVGRAEEDRYIARELVTSDDAEALRVLGLIVTHADPVGFCDCALAEARLSGRDLAKGVVLAERCETIHRAMRQESHAA